MTLLWNDPLCVDGDIKPTHSLIHSVRLILLTDMCPRNVGWVFFHNLKQLEPILIIFAIQYPKIEFLNVYIISHLSLATGEHISSRWKS